MHRALVAPVALVALVPACRDLSRFTASGADHFEGTVTLGSFVRSGILENTRMCLTLDANHLQDAPGALWSNDGRFWATPLRPIPQIWNDPLSTLSFGEGRVKNLVYAVSPNADAGDPQDVLAVVSLLQTGDVEVRLLRSAPGGTAEPIFGVFALSRKEGPCSF